MTTSERRHPSVREIEENATRGIIDEPDIALPYDALGNLVEGAEWLDPSSPEERPAVEALDRSIEARST